MFRTIRAVSTLVFLWGMTAQPHARDAYYFFQRTAYTENLITPGAWWSNPALISSIDRTTIFTATTGLIGRQFSISLVRGLFPVAKRLNAGFGLTGTASGAGAGGMANNAGFSYESYFNFTRPSLETGISFQPSRGGTLGAMLVGGTKSDTTYHAGGSDETVLYLFYGFGAGWISPPLLNTVSLSLNMLSVRYNEIVPWTERCAKIGILINGFDSLIMGSVEYALAADSSRAMGTLFNNPATTSHYEVFKAKVSVRFRSIAGLLLGYSTDTENYSNNSHTGHLGLELRKSNLYPYYGGYEMGISSARNWSVFHQIWLGVNINRAQ